jgi:fatty-acid desaturase
MDGMKTPERIDAMQTAVFIGIHVLGLWGAVYFWWYPNATLFWAAVGYFFLCHLSITIGAHRYFTHGAFVVKRPLAYVLAVIFSGVLQGPLSWWVGKHLQHHQWEDIPGQDPHTPLDGFFHSHMGWLLKPSGITVPRKEYLLQFKKPGVANEVIRWQQKHYVLLAFLMGFAVPTLLGWLLVKDAFGGVLVIGFTRLVFQYHCTWMVNSVGHTFGTRRDNLATNFGTILILPITAILTVGEAWHANHHTSSAHWRLGRKWWQIDLGAYVIQLLFILGLVSNLKEPVDRLRVPQARDPIR